MSTPNDVSRRNFMRSALTAGAGAAAVAVVPKGVAAVAEPDEQPRKPAKGYRMTRHIAEYYKSASL